MNSNKKRKRLLIVSSVLFVTIFLVVFIINYSFAGIKTHRLDIPKSTCNSKDLPLLEQDSSCEEKAYLEKISEEYSLEDLYEIWGAFNDDQQEFIISYLNDIDSIKGKELNDLVENIKSEKIVNNVDGNEVTVITEIPRNTSIEVEKTDKEKLDIIEDLDVGIIDNDNYVESYTYDISMNNNKSNYVENEALITISDIKADNNKKYFVYHLLDSLEAIGNYANSDNLIVINSDKLSDDFSRELEAGKDYSNYDNRIYAVREEVNINNDGSISFTTNSFSTFHIVGYTVDFHYDDKVYSINGEESILLSQLFKELNIEKDAKNAVSVMFSNEELVSVSKVENDWLLTSLQAFDTEEKLTMIFDNGEFFELKVTDDNTYQLFEDLSNRSHYFTEAQFTVKSLQSKFTRWVLYKANCNDSSSCLTTGNSTKLAETTTNNASIWGYQYVLNSDNYWFYSEQYDGGADLYNGDGGIHNIEVFLKTLNAMYTNVYAVPRVTFDQNEICTIKQGSASALSYQTKAIYVYANSTSNLLGFWFGNFPYRSGDQSYGLGNSESDAWNFLYSTSENCGHKVSKGSYDGLKVTINKPEKYYYDSTDCNNRSVNSGSGGYTLNVILKTRFKVAFNSNGGSGTMSDENFIYTFSKNLTSNSFTRNGYSFVNWNTKADGSGTSYSNGQSVSNLTSVAGGTVTLYAQWLGDPKNYTVNHYKQNLDGTYTLDSSSSISGKRVGDQTAATANNYTGFTAKPFNQETIGVDGATINIYYDRNVYNYTIYHKDINTNNAIRVQTTGSALYGSTITVKTYVKTHANSGLVGYLFIDNSTYLPTSTITISENSTNNVATIYYYYYERDYTVSYYTKNLENDNYSKYGNDVTRNGPIYDVATYDIIDIPGFHYSYVAEGTTQTTGDILIPETGNLVIRVFYDRNSYNISYSYSGNVPEGAPSLPPATTALYESSINLPSVNVTGYDFSWNQNSPLIVSGNTNIVGTFTPKNNAFYRVRYYLKGTNTEIKNMDEVANATYNQSYEVNAPSITGFTLDDTTPKSVTAGYAGDNNEISFSYTANTVNYTVNRCLGDLEGNGCTSQSETLQGKSLDPISYQQSEIEGFTFDHAENNSNGVIAPDGSTIVTVYYTRNSHNVISCVTKDDDNTYNNCQSTSYMYGETIVPLTNPSENYYNFSGWTIDTPNLNSLPNTMPDHDINVSGVLERKKEDLTIVADWGNNITGKIATFTIVDDNNNSLDVITNNNGNAIVKDLSVGKTYTITEVNCDIGYTCGNYITHTIIEGNNTITFTNTLIPNNKSWLKSENRNKNVFGVIQ